MSLKGLLTILHGHPGFRRHLDEVGNPDKPPQIAVRQGARACFIGALWSHVGAPVLVIAPRRVRLHEFPRWATTSPLPLQHVVRATIPILPPNVPLYKTPPFDRLTVCGLVPFAASLSSHDLLPRYVQTQLVQGVPEPSALRVPGRIWSPRNGQAVPVKIGRTHHVFPPLNAYNGSILKIRP